MKILCVTPIMHLNGVFEYLQSFGEVSYNPDLEKENFNEPTQSNTIKISNRE